MMAWAKKIYILMIEVKSKLILLNYRNMSESLRELEMPVAWVPTGFLILPTSTGVSMTRYMFSIS